MYIDHTYTLLSRNLIGKVKYDPLNALRRLVLEANQPPTTQLRASNLVTDRSGIIIYSIHFERLTYIRLHCHVISLDVSVSANTF